MKLLKMALATFLCTPVVPTPAQSGLPEPVRLTAGWELQEAGKVAEPGERISTIDYRPAGWYRAKVPGTVLTTLVANGVYPEPLYGENNRPDKIPDSLCRTSYWYRTTFTPPPSFAGKQVSLNFKGINYFAEVWVNGRQVGTIKGAFIRGNFNVTPLVKVGQVNAVAVHIFPQPHPGATHEKTIANGTGPNGGVTGLDGPTFLCTVGWDWIPTIRDRDTGIWQDVTLSASGPVVLENPYVTSKLPLPKTDTADLTVQATLRNLTDAPQRGALAGNIDSIRLEQDVSLGPREVRTITFSPERTPGLHIQNPRLWWPNGYAPGEARAVNEVARGTAQPRTRELYKLRLSFSVNGTTSDKRDTTFGIRQITYSLPGSDNLALSVNGVPVVAKGGDWGMDEAMKRLGHDRLDAMVRMHQIANYTMIRNWVGQSTSEDLYGACDKYGILLWDEFFEPHPVDGPIPEDIELYLANVKDKILRFRNHPSVALWCARNEGDPPPKIGEGIQKLINDLDPGRLYQPSSTSGRGVNSGGPYHWRTPREFYTYNEAFKTEIGSMSVPTLEAVRGMMPRQDWEVINDDWAEHDFCAGAQAGDQYPFIISSRYGLPASLPDFVRKAQLANYECFRAMYEGRFAKLFRPETGVITWMSSPAQSSFVWQLYSHDLEPNSSLFGTRVACEPVHIQMNQNDWRLMVVNNTPRLLNDLVIVTELYNLDGKRHSTQTHRLSADPSAATEAGAVPFSKGLSPVHFVYLQLRERQGRLLSENLYWRGAEDDPDNFTALNSMPLVRLDVQATRREVAGGKCLLDVSLRNPSKSMALLSHLQLRRQGSGERVLPVFYSDNYLSLLPGQTRSLVIEARSADLAGEQPLLAVDGWNVTARPTRARGGEISIIPNSDAEVRMPAPKRASGPMVMASINCGSGPFGFFRFGVAPLDIFVRDYSFRGGQSASATNEIDTHVPNAAPAPVYQTERWGQCSYTIPVAKAHLYTVRLHFAETRLGPGQRKFNVEVNGNRVLSDLDIAAEAGQNKALVKDIPAVRADAKGNLVIALTPGSADQPKICAIQVLK